MHKWLG